jgi:hypothetical protein
VTVTVVLTTSFLEEVAVAFTLDGIDGGLGVEGITLGVSSPGQAAKKISKTISAKIKP